MNRCHICDSKTKDWITLECKRYFHGTQNVCLKCFNLWCRWDYEELDKRALEKLK
jgi:hypothetical protein